MELADEGVVVVALVARSVPSGINMDGIAEVDVVYGILGIVGILRLVACSRHPDDPVETIVANDIDNWLEEVAEG